jgi:hypothetical protein
MLQSSRIAAVAVVSGILLLAAAANSEAWSLKARLLDTRSDSPPTTATLSGVNADSEHGTSALIAGSDGRFSADLPAKLRRVMLVIDAKDKLVARKVPLMLGHGRASAIPLTLYVVEREPVTFRYPAKAIGWFESNEIDRALAAFEFAYRDIVAESSDVHELRVTVEYYYALALRRACEGLRYDTCAAAEERFQNLIRNYRGNERYYRTISVANLEAAAAAARRIQAAVRYDEVTMLYKAADYDGAAEAAEALLADAAAGRVHLTAATIDRVRLDAASARTKHGDDLMKQNATAEAVTNYKQALRLNKAVETLDRPRAVANVDLLSRKLSVPRLFRP